jgi:hypothetical protein
MTFLPSQRDDGDDAEDAVPVWSFLLVLFFFKLATVALIFWQLRTWESGIILGSTLWFWFPPLLFLGAGPILFYYLLRKVRARREALRRSEWMISDEQDVKAQPTPRS